MCTQCNNEDFIFEKLDSVNVDGENYTIMTQDTKDTFSMVLSGVTFGDTYAATMIVHTGEHALDTNDKYNEAILSGVVSPETSKSFVVAYKGDSSDYDVQSGHESAIQYLKAGFIPSWMTVEEQQQALMYQSHFDLSALLLGGAE